MDLKEKILKENLLSIEDRNIQKNVGDRWEQFNSEKSTVAIYKSMDELSKIVAIAFAKWVMDNTFQDLNTENSWCASDKGIAYNRYTDEQLYALFTQSKEYKELMDGK